MSIMISSSFQLRIIDFTNPVKKNVIAIIALNSFVCAEASTQNLIRIAFKIVPLWVCVKYDRYQRAVYFA